MKHVTPKAGSVLSQICWYKRSISAITLV